MNPLVNFIYHHLSEDVGGNCMPPGSSQRAVFGRDKYIAVANEFGGSIWVSYPEGTQWKTHFDSADAVEFAKFVLWRWWILGTWCGLKSKLYYWALHRKIAHDKATMSRQPYTNN